MTAALVFFCLVSYNPHDSSFNALSYRLDADNWAGRLGAFTSDLLFQIFGLTAYMLVLPLGILGWKLLRGREITSPFMRGVGLLFIICTVSMALQLAPISMPDVNFMPGGTVGVLLVDLLVPYLGFVGTGIVLLGVFILGILAATTFSFERTFERFVRKSNKSTHDYRNKLWRWWQNRKKVRRVVNIKPASPPAMQITPRPEPVKPSPPPPISRQEKEKQDPPPQQERSRKPPVDLRPKGRKYTYPPIDLLSSSESHFIVDESDLMERARQLAEKCAEFDVNGSIAQIHPGPVVTTFEFKPDAGIKYSRITGLAEDLCLGVKAESIRIDRIPGKATVGIEIPNSDRETIMLRDLIESDTFRRSSSKLTLALGKSINGSSFVSDLSKMPHLLIAGATGAGKSVALNCMITSILYKTTPEEVRFILIDPKRLELGVYADIPHLLTPIVTDAKEAANALRWATNEMEIRYKRLALRGVRNVSQYNDQIRDTGRQLSLIDDNDTESELEKPLPFLVLVIDELADLMMVSSREVEESISRLAAMARAVGIHLILATQRPSVDVITGVIKANFPCRIAFKVATKVDSRTIIDANGAEQLLGSGDMLFIPPASSRLIRIHGAYVNEKETQLIVEHLREQGRPSYDDKVLTYGQEELDEAGNPVDPAGQDSLYPDALRIVVSEGRASTSLLQRRLSIGYGRAAKLVDMMHLNGLVGPSEGSKPREVLVGLDFLDRLE